MSTNQDFSDFYRAAFAPVSAAARAFCGSADVAHESTQEAFAKAFARWPRLAQQQWAQAWVTTTALNLCRRRLRHLPPPIHGGLPILGPTSDRVELLTALRALPERQRQATVLYYLADCPVATVADLMGLSEGTVKSHLFKARAALRKSLEVRHA